GGRDAVRAHRGQVGQCLYQCGHVGGVGDQFVEGRVLQRRRLVDAGQRGGHIRHQYVSHLGAGVGADLYGGEPGHGGCPVRFALSRVGVQLPVAAVVVEAETFDAQPQRDLTVGDEDGGLDALADDPHSQHAEPGGGNVLGVWLTDVEPGRVTQVDLDAGDRG